MNEITEIPTRALEPDRSEIEDMGRYALDFMADRIEELATAPASDYDDVERLIDVVRHPPTEGSGDLGKLLEIFREAAGQGANTAHGGYFAYVPSGGLITSALADMLAQTANRYTGLAQLAPVLTAMEQGVLRWFCALSGLPAGADGVTTTGASMATLSALVAARQAHLGDDFRDGTLYVTDRTHACVAKAARVAGLPQGRLRMVPTDARLRMDVREAARMISADRAAGRRPFLLVGTAGMTDTGAIDPLPELAALARREGMWFHTDAAYGGGFRLTERGRERMAGIEGADSIAFDPHKSLFLPHGTGVLLVRDPATLYAAHSVRGRYLQDLAAVRDLPDYGDLGMELTREFRGLRLWLPLHLHGVRAFRDALDERLDLASYVHAELAADQRFEVPWEPELSVVAFRLPGDNERSRQLLADINATREVFLSSTTIHGRFFLRLCILSQRTRPEHVDRALKIIRSCAN